MTRITIDPVTAKDFDDAFCLQPAGSNRWRLWVHIADVSWYVKEGSGLDREALERGTSVYLVDRVIPMLPEALSSDLCSLVPGQDRLTLSVVLDFDPALELRERRIVRGVIRSHQRLAYEDAQALLDGVKDSASVTVLPALRDLSAAAARVAFCKASSGSRAAASASSYRLNTAASSRNALNSRAFPAGSRTNSVPCSHGSALSLDAPNQRLPAIAMAATSATASSSTAETRSSRCVNAPRPASGTSTTRPRRGRRRWHCR